jgi:hemoglobin
MENIEYWIEKVSHQFYELVYQDEWFKNIFKVIKQEIITSQQIDFMVGAFGGPKRYSGRMPQDAHPHIFINEDIWEHREYLLNRAFEKVDCPAEIRTKWLKIENAFKRQIIMTDPSECKRRFTTDDLIIFPKPFKKIA